VAFRPGAFSRFEERDYVFDVLEWDLDHSPALSLG
jgi:hypothetical protein